MTREDQYLPPENTRMALYLRFLAEKGATTRYGHFSGDLKTRIEYELDVLTKARFEGYFLLVADILRFCRERSIPTGPGRGSICGSVVAYATRITDVDPLRFDIPFERFLHLERVAQPDIDLDICQVRRGEVIEYLRTTYGSESVAQIITFTPLNAKGVVRDVCRVLHVDEILRGVRNNETGEKLAALIPEGSGADQIKLQEYIESKEGAVFAEKIKQLQVPYGSKTIDVLESCLTLEGIQRHGSVHAAGVVIADKPLIELVPLYRKNQESESQTQFDMRDCETLGLLKMDVLGLRTVTVIGDAEALVRQVDPIFSIKDVPLNDQRTFDIISRGDTDAIFQLEGEGITNACKGMRPDKFDDIIALISLYRPGPMEQLGDYFARKHGEADVEYAHPLLEPILRRSYGLIVYQEQVMGIVRALGGYTAGEADMFRKAIGKKLIPLIKENISEFEKRAINRGHDAKIVHAIGEQIFYFGRYGFNLGHATGYAFLTYWTAYLKANWPLEFYTANLNSVVGVADKIGSLLRDAEKHAIVVHTPDINSSKHSFTIKRRADQGDSIVFGIGAIKGIGDSIVTDIIEERDSDTKNEYSNNRIDKVKPDGTPYKANSKVITRVKNYPRPFDSYYDFCRRLPRVNIAAKRALIKAGCFGSDAGVRSALMINAELINDAAKLNAPHPQMPDFDLSDVELLRMEKEVLGFYITNHPLQHYKQDLQRYDATIDGKFEDLPSKAVIGGMVINVRLHQAKNGEMAWVKLESGIDDLPDITMFASIWGNVKPIVEKDAVVVVYGKKEHDPRFGWAFKADHVLKIDRARPDARLIHISVPSTDITDLLNIRSMGNKTGAAVQIAVEDGPYKVLLATNLVIQTTGVIISMLESLGYIVQLNPIPNGDIPWNSTTRLVQVDDSFVGSGPTRKPAWELGIVKAAHKLFNASVLATLI